MTKAEFEKRVEKHMKALDLTREEAIALVQDDEAVDKMTMKELNAELTEGQKEAMKKAKATGERKKAPTNYKFDTKSKKKDDEKVQIVQKIFDFTKDFTENCTISNEGREITFTFGENSYSLVLTKHRNSSK